MAEYGTPTPETDDRRPSARPEDRLARIREHFRMAEEADGERRRAALEDARFSAGDQWPPDILAERDADGRPCLTINRLEGHVRQVTNEQRQNRPQIRCIPVDDRADPETAKMLTGLLRHIQVDSNADVAYDTAAEWQVRAGLGYFRLLTDYETPDSFDQVLKIARIRNPFCVYLDPSHQEPDGADAEWGFVFTRLSKERYRELYPDSAWGQMESWQSTGDQWILTDECRLAEYFCREREPVTLCLLSTGTVWPQHELPDPLPPGVSIVQQRPSYALRVRWMKTNGYEILEETDWPGDSVPIYPVVGNELDLNGKVQTWGLVRNARDAQRMYNYWISAETETIALAPKAPWIGAEGQFEGHEREWKTANTRNYAFLEYKPKSLNGQPLQPPSRNVMEPPIQAITLARQQSADDIKACTGIYDASLGARSNETSGRAIVARQREGDMATYQYMDNLARTLKRAGRDLVRLIPKIYDRARVVRLLGEDGASEPVTLNAPFVDAQGIERLYDVRLGTYDVVVDVGPSYATKRQETVATMLDLSKAFPPLMQVAGDLLVKNMDWPQAQEVSERLQSLLPPELKPQPGSDPKAQMQALQAAIPQLQEKMRALDAYAQQMEAAAEKLQAENEQLRLSAQTKAAELTLKEEQNEAQVQRELGKLRLEEVQLQIEQARLQLEAEKLQIEREKMQRAPVETTT